MSDDELTPKRVAALTTAVDIEASPPDGEPVALVLFGTNQDAPTQIAAARYHAGAAKPTASPARSRTSSWPLRRCAAGRCSAMPPG